LRPGTRYFPVWSFPPLRNELPDLSRSRYAPIDIPQRGHTTSLACQSGLDDYPTNSPSHIVVEGTIGNPNTTRVRPDFSIGSGFIARYVVGPPKSVDHEEDPGAIVDEVLLLPTTDP